VQPLLKSENHETEELGRLEEYGLSIDFVEAGTFPKQRENYLRYQLSWGGPSEEFRIYENGEIEFWFLDWFDGASYELTSDEADIIKEAIDFTGNINDYRD